MYVTFLYFRKKFSYHLKNKKEKIEPQNYESYILFDFFFFDTLNIIQVDKNQKSSIFLVDNSLDSEISQQITDFQIFKSCACYVAQIFLHIGYRHVPNPSKVLKPKTKYGLFLFYFIYVNSCNSIYTKTWTKLWYFSKRNFFYHKFTIHFLH